ncbi:hypothetical protein V6N13_056943 [Hibiscus sabdariffa]
MDGFGADGVRVNPEIESDSDKSNELHSDHDYDSDGPRFSEFNTETDMVNPKFVKGLIFSDRNVLKEAIKHYGRVNRVQVKLQKMIRRGFKLARELEIEMIEGNYKGQYARIYEYLLELMTKNPGTTIICHLDARLFQRMYGCLLATRGIYANDGIYPIAYAAME